MRGELRILRLTSGRSSLSGVLFLPSRVGRWAVLRLSAPLEKFLGCKKNRKRREWNIGLEAVTFGGQQGSWDMDCVMRFGRDGWGEQSRRRWRKRSKEPGIREQRREGKLIRSQEKRMRPQNSMTTLYLLRRRQHFSRIFACINFLSSTSTIASQRFPPSNILAMYKYLARCA